MTRQTSIVCKLNLPGLPSLLPLFRGSVSTLRLTFWYSTLFNSIALNARCPDAFFHCLSTTLEFCWFNFSSRLWFETLKDFKACQSESRLLLLHSLKCLADERRFMFIWRLVGQMKSMNCLCRATGKVLQQHLVDAGRSLFTVHNVHPQIVWRLNWL